MPEAPRARLTSAQSTTAKPRQSPCCLPAPWPTSLLDL